MTDLPPLHRDGFYVFGTMLHRHRWTVLPVWLVAVLGALPFV